MDTRLAKRNYSIQQWKAIIQDRNNTNLTVDEYCKQNGLSRNSYFYWLRIIREEALEQSAESGFVELSLPAETDSGAHQITAVPITKPEPSQLTFGHQSNVVLNDETVLEMQKRLMETGYPVSTLVTYSNMENYESVDRFLEECTDGKSGSVVIYEIYDDGGIGRMKFIFDGTEMYVVSARGIWNDNNKPGMSYISYTRIKEWKYTEKGWFGYELCVPEPPEVSEIVDGSCLIRIKPMTEEQREMSERLVLGLGYQGQNLLCSNWSTENMSDLDYNGMFEYLYGMKYGKKFNSEDYPNGIPKEEFESLIMEYLPVTAEQIREYAVFDEEKQTYYWERLGCFNYTPTFFGTSLPEVVGIKENDDGTVTLTVEAVCDTVICNDAVITHELTVRFAEDGSFQYLGNEILNDGITSIPDYQYRIRKE